MGDSWLLSCQLCRCLGTWQPGTGSFFCSSLELNRRQLLLWITLTCSTRTLRQAMPNLGKAFYPFSPDSVTQQAWRTDEARHPSLQAQPANWRRRGLPKTFGEASAQVINFALAQSCEFASASLLTRRPASWDRGADPASFSIVGLEEERLWVKNRYPKWVALVHGTKD